MTTRLLDVLRRHIHSQALLDCKKTQFEALGNDKNE